jgi:hypothetical protein
MSERMTNGIGKYQPIRELTGSAHMLWQMKNIIFATCG